MGRGKETLRAALLPACRYDRRPPRRHPAPPLRNRRCHPPISRSVDVDSSPLEDPSPRRTAALLAALPYNRPLRTRTGMAYETAIDIRPLTQIDEFADAVRLQQEIWGFEDIELLPRRLFVVASKIGGQVLGAFDQAKMVGFSLCVPGLK